MQAATPSEVGRSPCAPRTHRTLQTAKQAHLSVAQRSRLDHILAADVELAVVRAIKEITVQLLATRTGADFEAQW